MAIRKKIDEVENTFINKEGWKVELEVAYRQRRSVIFVIAGLVAMAAFWDNTWTWAAFFSVLAIYALLAGVRIGFICGLSFAIWFTALAEWPVWFFNHHTISQAIGLWCIATLFFVVVWKKDGVEQVTLRKEKVE